MSFQYSSRSQGFHGEAHTGTLHRVTRDQARTSWRACTALEVISAVTPSLFTKCGAGARRESVTTPSWLTCSFPTHVHRDFPPTWDWCLPSQWNSMKHRWWLSGSSSPPPAPCPQTVGLCPTPWLQLPLRLLIPMPGPRDQLKHPPSLCLSALRLSSSTSQLLRAVQR